VVAGQEGPRSSEVTATTPDLEPLSIAENDPGGPVLATTGLAQYLLTIEWEDLYAGATESFNVYRSTTPGGEGATPYEAGAGFSMAASMVGGQGGGAGCSGMCGGGDVFLQTQLAQPPGTTYYYELNEVITVNGQSYVAPRSNEIAVTTTEPPGPPSPARIKQINVLPALAHRTQAATNLVVDFSGALNPADAANLAAYHLVSVGRLNRKTGQHPTRAVKVIAASYNPAADTVTLAIKGKLPNQPLELSVNTTAVRDASGQPIAGNSGQPGGSFQTTFGKKGLILASV
jgi:hypothetical protein